MESLVYGPFDEFIEIYQSGQKICIFTGAGVSFTQDLHYRAPEWKELLKELFMEFNRDSPSDEVLEDFIKFDKQNKELWHLASEIHTLYVKNNRDFNGPFRNIILRQNKSLDKDGRLKLKNLKGATTLNALISFCSKVKKEIKAHPCFEANPRIEAILTSNYDGFLEAGFTTKHNSKLFEQLINSKMPSKTGKLPVYHLHGYLRLRESQVKVKKNKVLNKQYENVGLVLTYKSYESIYTTNSWQVEVLRKFLSNHTTLFIGFSFEDKYILNKINEFSCDKHPHFALLRECDNKNPEMIEKIINSGIKPLFYKEHIDIPDILKKVYFSGLKPEDLKITKKGHEEKVYKKEDVWNMLFYDKRWKDQV